MAVTFKSRLPAIALELEGRVDVAVKLAAEGIALGAKARAPVGAPDVHLRDAIHVERQGLGEYAVIAGDDEVFYGHMVEFGTRHSAPHPFLVPAFEDGKREATAAVRAALRHL